MGGAERTLHRGLAAATVVTRHLARGSDHAALLPQPWLASPSYRSALTALRSGDLVAARDLAARSGPPGRVLAALVDGELAALTAPLPRRRPVAPVDGDLPGVLHLVTNALPETVAGYTVRTQGIAAAQARLGQDVHVVSRLGFPLTQGHLSAAPEVRVGDVRHHRLLPARLPLRSDAALRADVDHSLRIARAARPGVLHAHSNHLNGRVGLALRERLGVPLVYEVRGLLEQTWLSRPGHAGSDRAELVRLTRAAETAVMLAADAVVTLSQTLREVLLKRGVPAERLHVVPNCVDADWLDEPAAEHPGEALTVGLAGTLNDYEGLSVLVDAVALLRSRGADVRLLVIGDGPARAELERRAAGRGLGATAAFTGRVPPDEVRASYRRLDVLCLPRLDLPVTRVVPPLKPVEAMALGLPVVASDLPPLRELLGEGRGRLVPAGDTVALAAAIDGLRQPAARRALGARGRDWVRRTRTWEAAAATYHDIYLGIRGDAP